MLFYLMFVSSFLHAENEVIAAPMFAQQLRALTQPHALPADACVYGPAQICFQLPLRMSDR